MPDFNFGNVDLPSLDTQAILGDIQLPTGGIALQKFIPALAKDRSAIARIEDLLPRIKSTHLLRSGDARSLSFVQDESVQLLITSPPYWTLKAYPDDDGQLGAVNDYEQFLDSLDAVWSEALRALVPGGRMVIVVGDVCLPRRLDGRHRVVPLHSSIQEHCRDLGFDNLAPIIWHKIANASFEAEGNGGGFLGKPYEPNAVIKHDIEFILSMRKPGGYRSPGMTTRLLSVVPAQAHSEWFSQIWTVPGASTRLHPAPFPLEVAERLVRMFSFVGDTVIDPFMGTGTTNLAAAKWGRNSIGLDIHAEYVEFAGNRLAREMFSQQPLLITS
jgi:DNA modification methylase